MSEQHIPRVGILASGGGTTAEAYARAIHDEQVGAEIGVVIASREDAGILDKVKRWNDEWGFDTDTFVVNNREYPGGLRDRGQSEESAEVICRIGQRYGLDLFAQLGYMIIGNDPYIAEWGFVPQAHTSMYEARALNTHPGLLPLTADTHGDGAAKVMLDAFHGEEITEAKHTLHVVAQEIDAGPIVSEHPVPIEADDVKETLFDRIQIVEKATIGYAIDAFLRSQRKHQDRLLIGDPGGIRTRDLLDENQIS